MPPSLLSNALRPALWGALGIAAVLAAAGRLPTAGGVLAGALWNITNLFLLQSLALAWGREQRRRALTLLLVKLLLLYPAGLALALSNKLSLVAIIAGFSWPFVVLIGCAIWSGRTASSLTGTGYTPVPGTGSEESPRG
ncbi:MAG: hypothetical protein HY600_06050 [Candidatus Omnitrophica bacterium]|nr:hypothetical protein [Candidatus Omnitrophota bacterium]